MAAESSSYVTLETLICTFIWQKKERKENNNPKDRTKYVALQITDAPLETFPCKCYRVSI